MDISALVQLCDKGEGGTVHVQQNQFCMWKWIATLQLPAANFLFTICYLQSDTDASQCCV